MNRIIGSESRSPACCVNARCKPWPMAASITIGTTCQPGSVATIPRIVSRGRAQIVKNGLSTDGSIAATPIAMGRPPPYFSPGDRSSVSS
jgi:hypothetical protein